MTKADWEGGRAATTGGAAIPPSVLFGNCRLLSNWPVANVGMAFLPKTDGYHLCASQPQRALCGLT